ncbi:hypothetical protein DFQ26_007674, partial [Actinomortierella ambigua]
MPPLSILVIPHVANDIVQQLTKQDLRACVLVSRAWYTTLRRFLHAESRLQFNPPGSHTAFHRRLQDIQEWGSCFRHLALVDKGGFSSKYNKHDMNWPLQTLEVLNAHCRGLRRLSLKLVSMRHIEQLKALLGQNIHVVDVTIEFKRRMHKSDAEHLQDLLQQCPGMRSLHLQYARVQLQTLLAIGVVHAHLAVLTIVDSVHIDALLHPLLPSGQASSQAEGSVVAVGQNGRALGHPSFPSLLFLSIHQEGSNMDIIARLLQHCPKLRALTLSIRGRSSWGPICAAFREWRCCPELHSITLERRAAKADSVFAGAHSEAAWEWVLRHLRGHEHMHHVGMTGRYLTQATFITIAQHHQHRIRSLTLINQLPVPAEGVRVILTRCSMLEVFDYVPIANLDCGGNYSEILDIRTVAEYLWGCPRLSFLRAPMGWAFPRGTSSEQMNQLVQTELYKAWEDHFMRQLALLTALEELHPVLNRATYTPKMRAEQKNLSWTFSQDSFPLAALTKLKVLDLDSFDGKGVAKADCDRIRQ